VSQPILYGVYAAEFPYLESIEDKVRPVIVVSASIGKHGIIAVVPVTSKTYKQSIDSNITSWGDSGLLRPSVARVHRLSTILQSKLGTYLGALESDDTKELKESMRQFLAL
jgi:mRNA-degrading endonuclease toxin of MazEF toxin-antitoxin module